MINQLFLLHIRKMDMFIFKNNQKGFIDIDYLESIYNEGNLEGAVVFSKLFNLCKDNSMNYSMKKNKTGLYTLFKDLDISFEEWSQIMIFLKTNRILGNIEDNNFKQTIENIHISINKLGGFPSFDRYLEKIFTKIEKIELEEELRKSIYNPMTPEEDYLHVYHWVVGSVVSEFRETYTYTKTIPGQESNTFYYMRGLQNQSN